MVKTKKSFIEKITGSRKADHHHNFSRPIHEENEHENLMDQNSFSNSFNHAIEEVEDEYLNDSDEGQLTIDVYQNDNEIIIKSTIAGVKPEDLDVAINNDVLTIKGERKNEEEISADNYYYQECYWGGFSRSVVLPIEVVPEKIEASLKNGILTIKLPKADTTKSKKIQVRGF